MKLAHLWRAAYNPHLEKMRLFRYSHWGHVKKIKDPPTWLKVATTPKRTPTRTHLWDQNVFRMQNNQEAVFLLSYARIYSRSIIVHMNVYTVWYSISCNIVVQIDKPSIYPSTNLMPSQLGRALTTTTNRMPTSRVMPFPLKCLYR